MNIRVLFLGILMIASIATTQSMAQTLLATGHEGQRVTELYKHKVQNVIVAGTGTVIEILKGEPQQCFIVRLANNQVLQISHDTNRAPRIATLQEGDIVEFRGVYEWTPAGGKISQTYSVNSEMDSGWLKHRGEIFQ
ncbi:DUF3465 domain-containing protein [Zhongshania sp.]|uniref:DUF3465 domain-containing protein n=1 Tax=Zhongshania sp. TaxID=1971902 RepID=UPI0035667D29